MWLNMWVEWKVTGERWDEEELTDAFFFMKYYSVIKSEFYKLISACIKRPLKHVFFIHTYSYSFIRKMHPRETEWLKNQSIGIVVRVRSTYDLFIYLFCFFFTTRLYIKAELIFIHLAFEWEFMECIISKLRLRKSKWKWFFLFIHNFLVNSTSWWEIMIYVIYSLMIVIYLI